MKILLICRWPSIPRKPMDGNRGNGMRRRWINSRFREIVRSGKQKGKRNQIIYKDW